MKPIVGITMGDPCGIGPEITIKALLRRSVYDTCRPLVVGSADVLRQAAAIVDARVTVRPVVCVAQAAFEPGVIDIIDQGGVNMNTLQLGVVQAQGGYAAFLAVRKAIELAMDAEIDVTVTGPLNKEALHLAGYHFSGHTEMYEHFTRTRDCAMMLVGEGLRVVHVSTHVALREACERCKRERVLRVIRLADEACRALGIENPRVAVAGLNPHAGENGLFGREEIEEIAPAVAEAVNEGIHAEGPFPPDTVFSRARGGLYDIVVAQYHDQGHIPLKVVGFQMDVQSGKWKTVTGVNITLGLPIIRTSVDHGTAFDQAGKGTASEESLLNAIDYGVRLARARPAFRGGAQ